MLWKRKEIVGGSANEAERIEREPNISAEESLARICEVIDRVYTPSASPPLPIPGTDAVPVRQK